MSKDIGRRALTVFCGKGGVGKTTLSLALGLWHARNRRRTVVVTSHPLAELALSVSLRGLREEHPQAAANLFVVHIDPREALTAKVRQQIPSRILANTVVSSRIYQSLIEIAPGLKEIAFLARLRQLAETRAGEGLRRFDRLVWDAPATGHFLQMLKASRDIEAYLSGPFALMGRELSEFLADPDLLDLLPVATPEEMAVEETIELCGRLQSEFRRRPATVVCNLASPLLALDATTVRGLHDSLPATTRSALMEFLFDRHAIERELCQRLTASVGSPIVVVERRVGWNTDLELLIALSDRLGENLALGRE